MSALDQEIEEIDMDKEISSKNSRIGAIRFLAEYAKNPNRKYAQVADKLGLNRKTAQNYLKKYIYLIESTRNDSDFLETVLEYYNYDLVQRGVDDKELFKASYIQQLAPLISRYGRILDENNHPDDDLDENKTVSYKNKNITNTYDNMSYEDEFNEYDDPEEERVNDGLRDMVDSNNTKILRKVLRHIPEIAPKHIPNLISLFKMREEELMKDPEAFKEFLLDYFNGRGRKAKLIFDSFSHMVKNYGNEYAGFGINPMTGVPYDADPFGRAGYGGQSGGFGVPNTPMNPAIYNSPQYYAYLAEKERTARQRREEDDINNSIGRYVKTATIGMLQSANQNKQGGGNSLDEIMKYAVLGIVRPKITMNPQTGQQEVVLEPTLGQQNGGMFGGQGTQGGENSIMAVMLKGIMDTNTALMTKQMNPESNITNKLLESVVEKTINGGNDLSRQVEQYKAMQEMFGGGKGHVKTPAEMEIDLKRDELQFKKELMINDMNNKQQQMMFERTAQQRQEDKADQNTKDIMSGITQTLQYVLQPILAGLQHGNLPAGLQGMMPGAQPTQTTAPPQQEVMGGEYGNEYDSMSPTMRAYFDRQKDDLMRNNEEQMAWAKKNLEAQAQQPVQMQPQPQPQQTQETKEVPQQRRADIGRKFTVRDFEDYSEEELMEAKRLAKTQLKSIKSYDDSIDEALAKIHYVRNEAFEDEGSQTSQDDVIMLPENIDPDYTGNIPKPKNDDVLAGSGEKKEEPVQVDTNAIFGITKPEEKNEIMSNEPPVLEEVDMDKINDTKIIGVEHKDETSTFKENQVIKPESEVKHGIILNANTVAYSQESQNVIDNVNDKEELEIKDVPVEKDTVIYTKMDNVVSDHATIKLKEDEPKIETNVPPKLTEEPKEEEKPKKTKKTKKKE